MIAPVAHPQAAPAGEPCPSPAPVYPSNFYTHPRDVAQWMEGELSGAVVSPHGSVHISQCLMAEGYGPGRAFVRALVVAAYSEWTKAEPRRA